MTPLRFDILTTFPELFGHADGCALASSIPARARAAGLVEWHARNIRDFTHDKHSKTDDRPFGGGPGMVMMCQPLFDAVHAVEALDPRPATRIVLTPQGTPLTQSLVESLAQRPRLLLIAGHYEGIDERVIRALNPLELSIGDFVLSGGELAALVLMDAIIRLIPGALGDQQSSIEDSFSVAAPFIGGPQTPRRNRIPLAPGTRLLDCPHFTQPREWMGMPVPDVLLSGNHAEIERWRLMERIERTKARRPDLLASIQDPITPPAAPPTPPPP
ncbi:MAG: tRNA (guanosine(37)-N1)-methyltransferase TrmD, partial [Phycisphaerales bacterium]